MIRYILECLVFQLVFLLTYDLFLKKETFFQWNRWYLLATFVLSMILPWVKIQALKTTVNEESIVYPLLTWQLDEIVLQSNADSVGFWSTVPWEYVGYGLGALLMGFWFVAKLFQIRNLKRQGQSYHLKEYTKVLVPQSEIAFSFFRNIFLGKEIKQDKMQQIIAHELVHVKHRHSIDLIFFELMRIALWFNPLVYLYQKRISELHEFMADAIVAKENRKEQYQFLLSEAFQTQNISFINQFFKKSLIKKRIVMLTKEKSKTIYQLKYAMLLPVLLAMLIYTSCERENEAKAKFNGEASLAGISATGYSYDAEENTLLAEIKDLNAISQEQERIQEELLTKISESKVSGKVKMVDEMDNSLEIVMEEGRISRVNVNKPPGSHLSLQENDLVPFGEIDEVPIFPGCDEIQDKKGCFMKNVQGHVKANFRYPEEAKTQGIQGRVNVLFSINGEGRVVNLKTRGPHPLLEQEAERIIGLLPRMQPGKHQGKVVDMPFSLPITFKL